MKKISNKTLIIIGIAILAIILISITGYSVWKNQVIKKEETSQMHPNNETKTIDTIATTYSNIVENQIDDVVNELQNTTNEIEEDPNQGDVVEEKIEITKEEIKEAKVEKPKEEVKKSSAKYYLKVNYRQNVVTVYTKDKNGKYTVPVKAMVCSSGTATPRSGVYKTSKKWTWRALNGGVAGQYATKIVGNILFHSVPYNKIGDKTSLKYRAYDKLGVAASAGCIRLTVADAKWVYNNCALGTMVEFYSSSNPGPLGKPSARKISNESASVRGWDPTDPDPRNPWKEYDKKKKAEKAKEEQNKKPANSVKPSNSTTPNVSNSPKPSNTPTSPSTSGGTGSEKPQDDNNTTTPTKPEETPTPSVEPSVEPEETPKPESEKSEAEKNEVN